MVIKKQRKARREILDGKIFFLSLVDEGANDAEILLKNKDLQRIESVAKLGKDKLLYTLVYGPDHVDSDGDMAKRGAVQKISHSFIKNMKGSGIDVMHNCQPVDADAAQVCESFIIQKNGDDRFKGVKLQGRVIEDTSELEGWWAAVIKLNDAELRAPFESGEWGGVSMYGPALVRDVAKSDFTSALSSRLGNPQTQDSDMDPKELAAAIALALTPLNDSISALGKRMDDADSKKKKDDVILDKSVAPAFDGDRNDLAAIEAYEEDLFAASLDLTKAADLKKWKAHLVAKAEIDDNGETAELRKAKANAAAAEAKVKELLKGSNQTPDEVSKNENDTDRMTRIRKSAKETANKLLVSQGRAPATSGK